jgi:pimeloyl-ACP methyl ester carboxylesterase
LPTSDKIMIYGHSQGGQSALFAGEIAPSYAPELHILGVAAAAPVTGLTTVLSVATGSFGQGILRFTLAAAYSWTKTYHDLPTGELFTPAGAHFAASELTHGCVASLISAIDAQRMTPATVFKKGFTTDPALVAHARLNDPGRVKELAPMLVVQGTADTTVPPPLTDAYVTGDACKIGDRIDYLHVTGASHGSIVRAALPALVAWMTARLHGSAAPTTCGRPGDVAVLSP